YNLHELINKLSEIEDLKWIRVLYLYPDNFSDELINEFKTNSKLLPYVDIPLQHISNNVLKRMNRHTNKNDIINLLNKLRNNIQNIVIRTTFIVGFPGETESDFNELNEFIQEYPFDKLGVFSYSREEGTPAYKMDSQIDEETKEIRRSKIMETQKTVSEKLCQRFIDREFEALVEEVIDDTNYVGRIYSDSPEIDGVLYIESDSKLEIGSFIKVKIIDSLEYDLIGEYIDERSK
ncbi:MAG: radical SAM protein, partial [Tissierellia bacterium]|nr:radical SAM protein [Tissierellia bacterium]